MLLERLQVTPLFDIFSYGGEIRFYYLSSYAKVMVFPPRRTPALRHLGGVRPWGNESTQYKSK